MEYLLSISLIIALFVLIEIAIKIKKERTILITLNLLASVLLLWKIIEFSYYAINHTGVYIIEFSHIAYFLVSILILTQIKKLYFTGGIYAFLASIGYIIPAIIFPKSVISNHSIAIVIMGIVSHMTLFFLSLLLLFKTVRFEFKNLYILGIFLSLTIIYVVLIDQGILYKGLTNPHNFVIIKLIHGELLDLLNIKDIPKIYNYLTSILIYIFIIFITLLMNFINNKIHKKEIVYNLVNYK